MSEATAERQINVRLDVYLHAGEGIDWPLVARSGQEAFSHERERERERTSPRPPDHTSAVPLPVARPLLRTIGFAALFLAVAVVSYRAGGSGKPAQDVTQQPSAAAPVQGPDGMPPALARELQPPPRVTPPPGAPAGSKVPSGPAAFGLGD